MELGLLGDVRTATLRILDEERDGRHLVGLEGLGGAWPPGRALKDAGPTSKLYAHWATTRWKRHVWTLGLPRSFGQDPDRGGGEHRRRARGPDRRREHHGHSGPQVRAQRRQAHRHQAEERLQRRDLRREDLQGREGGQGRGAQVRRPRRGWPARASRRSRSLGRAGRSPAASTTGRARCAPRRPRRSSTPSSPSSRR